MRLACLLKLDYVKLVVTSIPYSHGRPVLPTREILCGVTETRRGRDERPDATELAAYLLG